MTLTDAFSTGRISPHHLKAAAALGLVLASMATFARANDGAGPVSITIALPAARDPGAASQATLQDALDPVATGDEAQIVNAALPTSGQPLQLARPFFLKGSDVDERLAITCLSQAIYYEAASQPLEGQRAVAQVVLNRVRYPSFPKSVCGVVYQGAGSGTCQFTFVCNGSLGRVPSAGGWREAEAVARAALSGYVEPSVGEATHYHADYVAPAWAPLLAKIGTIGQHIFYRFRGAPGAAAEFTGRYSGEPRDPLTMRLAQATYRPMTRGADLAPAPHVAYAIGNLIGTALASEDPDNATPSGAAAGTGSGVSLR